MLINLNIDKSMFFKSNNVQKKIKPIFVEEYYDTFVSSIIENEKKSNNGKITQYKDFLTKKESKHFKKDLKDAIGTIIINNNLHIIKQGSECNKFIDIKYMGIIR